MFFIANQGEIDKNTLEGAIEIIRFAIEVCEIQHKSGRHFIFEQPQSSRAWSLNEVVKLTSHDGVMKTMFHQCMYGLEARDPHGVAPAYKPTSVLTNHPALFEVLGIRCDGRHRHAQLIGKSACSQAARHPPGLCAAVVKGIQVIKKKMEMIKEAQIRCLESTSSTRVPSGHRCDAGSPEDVLYELDLEEISQTRDGRSAPSSRITPWTARPVRFLIRARLRLDATKKWAS